MRMKRLLSGALAAATLCALLTVSPAAGAASTGFVDISDPQVSEAAALLRIMGVVSGNGYGYFYPDLPLTRAQFCKMAVEIRGEGDKADAQLGRTIFKDVTADHWGRGYINYASSIAVGEEGERLVMGVGDGTFHPDEDIAFDQAVTMTMRLLGYTSADVQTGATWYAGYLSTASSIGLLDGISAVHDAPVTRAQAAILFQNLLFTDPKGSDQSYLVSLGGSEVEGGVLLNVAATADDGSPALETTKGVYKTERTLDPSMEGLEGKALLDSREMLVAFVPNVGTSRRVLNVTSAEATYLGANRGEKLTIEPTTVVYREGKATTWRDCYLSVDSAAPSPVALHYGANGKLAYLYFSAPDPDEVAVAVARRVPSDRVNPFASMASGSSFTMYKNGVPATVEDIRQYDVATYDAGARVIQISDRKLTGSYEDASPSPTAPITITVMGHQFPVLSTARDDLTAFRVGDKITLLLTTDNSVAGVVSADAVKGEAVGVASISGETASVKLLQSGLEVSGKVSPGAQYRLDKQLVTVTSNAEGYLGLSPIPATAVKDALDVSARKLGAREMAENAVIYDRVKNGAVTAIPYGAITLPTIPADKIDYASLDYAGRVKYLVLNDATGDAYSYGYFDWSAGEWSYGVPVSPATLCVLQGDAEGNETSSAVGQFPNGSVRTGKPGGVAYCYGTRTSGGSVPTLIAATVELQALKDVPRSAFDPDTMTVKVGGVTWPISESVQCFNTSANRWFPLGKEGMEAARAYSETLTLYYDRASAEGGKIRLIEAP